MIKILKKNGEEQSFNGEKIKRAIRKSANRVCVTLTEKEEKKVVDTVKKQLQYNETAVPVSTVHNMVECALDQVNTDVAKSYRDYRDNKAAFATMLDKVYSKKLSLAFVGDRSNANADSALVTTQKAIVYNELNSELYKKFFLTQKEERAMSDGYFYIHDRGSRLDTINCFAAETEFITSVGIRKFADFNDGDTVRVITHLGNWKNAVVHSYGKQKLNKVTFKRGANSLKTVFCTANHRWILRDGSETTQLKVGDRLSLTPNIAEFEWDELTLEQKKWWAYGFCMGDGHTAQNSENSWYSYIRLFGHKCEYVDMFKSIGYTVTNPNIGIENSRTVYIPEFRKDLFKPEQVPFEAISAFVNGWLCADGHRNLTYNSLSAFRGIQVTGKSNSFIEDLLNIAGYYTTRKYDFTGQVTNFGVRNGVTVEYGFYSNSGVKSWFVDSIEPTDREETVWCLEVEDDHSFLLKSGIPTGNCCIWDMKSLLEGGFFMGNLDYVEPKTLDVAFDLIADVTLNAASSQYGGFTIPQVDKLLAPYAEKSYELYLNEYLQIERSVDKVLCDNVKGWKEAVKFSEDDCKAIEEIRAKAEEYAVEKVRREFEQGFQSWEMKFNSVASSRGDYPFTAVTFGLGTGRFESMASSVCMKVRKGGQGKPGFKHPVLFPKLSFFYDENLHGEGKELEWLFDEAIDCSSKTMYPDFISLTGDGYAPRIYKKYGVPISRMGCRAQTSPWFERGGMEPADENDKPIYDGRFNMGAISMHLAMIAAKAKKEDKDFFEVFEYYLDMVRQIHLRTFEYLSHKKAGINPLGFCQGGFYGGHKDPDEELGEDFLRPMTMSFGVMGLNEASVLWTGKAIHEDNKWAISVMKFINDYADKWKKVDKILYAIYGTPGESLCHTQIEQFRKKFGIIKGVSDREYTTNSFHCPVYAGITPIQKQDIEYPMFHLCNGGNIQYCRFTSHYNIEAFKKLTRRAMKLGFYYGNNQQLDWCEACGHTFIDSDTCPKCGSDKITRIERMNGYLSYSSVRGKTMYADHKLQEFKERVSM